MASTAFLPFSLWHEMCHKPRAIRDSMREKSMKEWKRSFRRNNELVRQAREHLFCRKGPPKIEQLRTRLRRAERPGAKDLKRTDRQRGKNGAASKIRFVARARPRLAPRKCAKMQHLQRFILQLLISPRAPKLLTDMPPRSLGRTRESCFFFMYSTGRRSWLRTSEEPR
jgi:hypothetical protein